MRVASPPGNGTGTEGATPWSVRGNSAHPVNDWTGTQTTACVVRSLTVSEGVGRGQVFGTDRQGNGLIGTRVVVAGKLSYGLCEEVAQNSHGMRNRGPGHFYVMQAANPVKSGPPETYKIRARPAKLCYAILVCVLLSVSIHS